MELAELKNYLRVDHDLDDHLLENLKATAEMYIKGAIEVSSTDDKRFDYAVTLLVTSWYENRNGTTNKTLQEIPFGVTSLIQQLRGLPNGANTDK